MVIYTEQHVEKHSLNEHGCIISVPQIYVTQYHPGFGYYLTTNEEQHIMQICIETNGVLTEPPHIHVETQTTSDLYAPAIGICPQK